MAIEFLQDDLLLTKEELKEFIENIDGEEFEVGNLGIFSFRNEGFIVRDCERTGVKIFVLEDLDNEYFYLLKLDYYYSDHYELSEYQNDTTLYAISSTDSLKY